MQGIRQGSALREKALFTEAMVSGKFRRWVASEEGKEEIRG